MSESLAKLQALLADALTSADPAGALKAAGDALPGVDEDGLRLSAILVARLRFERLVQGSNEARGQFETDPRAFTAAFKRYHTEVPPTATFPADEAELFAGWSARRSG